MNPKIFVGATVVGLVVIIGVVGFSGTSLIDDISDQGLLSPPTPIEIKPLQIELENIEILQINEKVAFLETKFKVTNPNQKSVILKLVKYELFVDDKRIVVSTIGERAGGGLVGGSNYITILSETSIILSDETDLRNTGNTPELWNALMSNTVNWKIKGQAFSNLSSMISGGENEVFFELTK
jgi:LEA14-like dessication related protein